MHEVIIVGAGISGLRCAFELESAGVDYIVLEKDSYVGGRCSSEFFEGYILDRGFQILLDSYEEVFSVISESDLGYRRFLSGALIDTDRGVRHLFDPFKNSGLVKTAFQLLSSDVGSLKDKWRIFKDSKRKTPPVGFAPESPTEDYLRERFSRRFQDEFLRPFWGSVFLDYDLRVPIADFFHLLRLFSVGFGGLPAKGMQAIPNALADKLPSERILLNSSVHALTHNRVELSTGESLEARQVILALPQDVICNFLNFQGPKHPRTAACAYFSADHPPFDLPSLRLNALTSHRLVKTTSVPTTIQPGYAPTGRSLISVNLDAQFDYNTSEMSNVVSELADLFGGQVQDWDLIKFIRIEQALPDYSVDLELENQGYIVCGDYGTTPSINNAFASGRNAADQYLFSLADN